MVHEPGGELDERARRLAEHRPLLPRQDDVDRFRAGHEVGAHEDVEALVGEVVFRALHQQRPPRAVSKFCVRYPIFGANPANWHTSIAWWELGGASSRTMGSSARSDRRSGPSTDASGCSGASDTAGAREDRRTVCWPAAGRARQLHPQRLLEIGERPRQRRRRQVNALRRGVDRAGLRDRDERRELTKGVARHRVDARHTPDGNRTYPHGVWAESGQLGSSRARWPATVPRVRTCTARAVMISTMVIGQCASASV